MKPLKRLLKLIVFLLLIYIFIQINNEWLKVTTYEAESEKIPSEFNGYKIVQVSDLHDALLGDNNKNLIQKVQKTDPDIIVFTGDLIDSRRYNLKRSINALKQLTKIAPVYYVIGNHEVATNELEEIYSEVEKAGAIPLENSRAMIKKEGEQIALLGIEDPLTGKNVTQSIQTAKGALDEATYMILLSHRPETFDSYVEEEMDLVLAGHAHGGQIRLPIIGGIVAPTQGLFPKYTKGLYEQDGTKMFVSGGIGNSSFPVRLFNRPEIIEITLKSSTTSP